MPDTTWAVSGYPPDSSRDVGAASVSMSSEWISTRQQQRPLGSSLIFPGPHVTQSGRTSSTTLKTTVFSPCPRGGSEPSSARRLWRPIALHLPYSAADNEPRHTAAEPLTRVHVH